MFTPALSVSVAILVSVQGCLPAQSPFRFRDVNHLGTGPVNAGSGFRALGATPGSPSTQWFSAMTPDTGEELWRTSGGMATPVGDHAPGPRGSYPKLIDPGPPAVFSMDDPMHGRELWRVNAQRGRAATKEKRRGPLGGSAASRKP